MRTIIKLLSIFAICLPLTTLAAPTPDVLVKASGPAVYYFANNGKRYVFPNQQTYASWFTDFSDIIKITDAELAAMPIGGNITNRPGIRMVKIQTDPKVYAVAPGGVLRWVTSEKIAEDMYGPFWSTAIDDVSDALFVNYVVGGPINDASDFKPYTVAQSTETINGDKQIFISTAARRSDTEVTHVIDIWRAFAMKDINTYRQLNGKEPLSMSPELNRIAMIHSKDMSQRNYAHVGSLGETADDRIRYGKVPNSSYSGFIFVPHPSNIIWTGENLAFSRAADATPEAHIQRIHETFMNESNDGLNHRTIMLSIAHPYSVIGIGPYIDPVGNIWLTEDFISVK